MYFFFYFMGFLGPHVAKHRWKESIRKKKKRNRMFAIYTKGYAKDVLKFLVFLFQIVPYNISQYISILF